MKLDGILTFMNSLNLLESFVREQLVLLEHTPRILDLDKPDIVQLLSDILGSAPLIQYTEKFAGQNFELTIKNGRTSGRFKDDIAAGYTPRDTSDLGGVARSIRSTGLHEKVDVVYTFEVVKPDTRPDYIDYALGSKTLAVEYSGVMKPEIAKFLNSKQPYVRFLCREDLVRKPKPLSPELRQKIQATHDKVTSLSRLTPIDKKEIEKLISQSLIQIFGESLLGGPPEAVFATGGEKTFKIPEFNYAEIQRIQAPIYATFSKSKSRYSSLELLRRIEAIAENSELLTSDKMIAGIAGYLKLAEKGMSSKGFRTFFSKSEAKSLLQMLNKISAGDKSQAYKFFSTIQDRINDRREWVSTTI